MTTGLDNMVGKFHLQQRVGHRRVSTIEVEHHPWSYETIVFGGREKDRIAHQEKLIKMKKVPEEVMKLL